MTGVSKLIFIVALAAAVPIILRKKAKDADRLPPPAFSVIAKRGEWVTRPTDGRHVCRLVGDLWSGMNMTARYCADWNGPIPARGQQVTWLRCNVGGGCQINVEGTWRP